MTEEQTHIVRLLRSLAASVNAAGDKQKGQLVEKVAQKVARSDNLGASLERLYPVIGWDAIALKLMWFAQRRQQAGSAGDAEEILEYETEQLRALAGLTEPRDGAQPAEAPQGNRVQASDELAESARAFGNVLDTLKRSSFDGEAFQGIGPDILAAMLGESAHLQQSALSAGNDDSARFATAFGMFVTFVRDRDMTRDVRVANFLETANLTLQTVMETVGEEDYDSLAQTVELLENPRHLFE